MTIIPRELQYIIIKKMDIDTRRSLGIFVKLKIPSSIFTKGGGLWLQD